VFGAIIGTNYSAGMIGIIWSGGFAFANLTNNLVNATISVTWQMVAGLVAYQ